MITIRSSIIFSLLFLTCAVPIQGIFKEWYFPQELSKYCHKDEASQLKNTDIYNDIKAFPNDDLSRCAVCWSLRSAAVTGGLVGAWYCWPQVKCYVHKFTIIPHIKDFLGSAKFAWAVAGLYAFATICTASKNAHYKQKLQARKKLFKNQVAELTRELKELHRECYINNTLINDYQLYIKKFEIDLKQYIKESSENQQKIMKLHSTIYTLKNENNTANQEYCETLDKLKSELRKVQSSCTLKIETAHKDILTKLDLKEIIIKNQQKRYQQLLKKLKETEASLSDSTHEMQWLKQVNDEYWKTIQEISAQCKILEEENKQLKKISDELNLSVSKGFTLLLEQQPDNQEQVFYPSGR